MNTHYTFPFQHYDSILQHVKAILFAAIHKQNKNKSIFVQYTDPLEFMFGLLLKKRHFTFFPAWARQLQFNLKKNYKNSIMKLFSPKLSTKMAASDRKAYLPPSLKITGD